MILKQQLEENNTYNMGLYKIFNYEKAGLVNQTMESGCKYNPIEDKFGNWFISKEEYKHCGLGVLTAYFAPIMDEII